VNICVFNKPIHPRSSRVAARNLRPASAIRDLIRRPGVQHREPRTALNLKMRLFKLVLVFSVACASASEVLTRKAPFDSCICLVRGAVGYRSVCSVHACALSLCMVMCAEVPYNNGWTLRSSPPAMIKLDGGTATFNDTISSLTWRGGFFLAGGEKSYDELVLYFEHYSDGTWSASGSGSGGQIDGCLVTCSTIPKASYGQWASINCAWGKCPSSWSVAFGINLTS
jgi:hypothetical protein